MTLTIHLIPGGYEIHKDGVPWIRQEHDPNGHPNEPIPEAQRQSQAEACLAQILAAQTPPPAPPALPHLKVVSIVADEAHAPFCQIDLPNREATCPEGTVLTVSGEFLNPADEIIPITASFRTPVRASDGREKVVLVSMAEGIFTAVFKGSASGIWEVSEAGINSALPAAQHMAFAGIKIYVLE